MQTAEQLSRKLTDSGLMSVAQLQAFCDTLPPDQQLSSAEDLSLSLVKRDVLTEYQAKALASPDSPPLVVGDYVVMEKIGAGGMGVVFKAEHRRMKRTVALKMLPHNFSQDESAIRRFEREVEVAAKLNHRNIVAALDAREQDGNHYLIMEFVPGQELSSVVHDNGLLSVANAADYILQAAIGLAHAHKLGVIHRDIKPSNLMLTNENVIKILDMGLARVELPTADGLVKTQSDLTNAGIIMGTLDYLSPEQALDSRKVDHRTDIYSLGCTLHYFLTGKPVYGGQTPMEKLVAHRERPIPSLCEARNDVPEELDAIFRRMMAKEVDDRFDSMTDVIASLETFLGRTDAGIQEAELVAERVESIDEPKSDFSHTISDAVSKAVSGVVSGLVSGVVSGVKAPLASAPVAQAPAPMLAQLAPNEDPNLRMSAVVSMPSWKQKCLVMIGRVMGATLGVFAGINLGTLFGWIGIVCGILAYLWFGWKWGAGYARMFSYQNGWTQVPPEHASGNLFRIENLKLHGTTLIAGAIVGTATPIGVFAGVFIAISILALKLRSKNQPQ